MATEILMPALSPTMSEGTLAKWHKKEGDNVESGDVVAEIETDKATMEVEAADEGELVRILVPAGTENVAVQTPIALLKEDGDTNSDIEERLKALSGNAPESSPPGDEGTGRDIEKGPASDAMELFKSTENLSEPFSSVSETGEGDGRIFASPLARKMAANAGLDISDLQGSGPHGRIVKMDVERRLEQGPASVPQVTRTEPGYVEIPHTTMRRTIANRMTEAKQTVPHFYLTVDCELDSLLKLREDLNAKAEALGQETRLSVNDFVIRAVALAMRKVPAVNVSWTEAALKMYSDVDISVAVSTPGGLVTPVIRGVDQQRLPEISKAMRTLANKARNGDLKPEDYQGGGFTISNLGMFGIKQFSAIVNPPQACILAVGAVEQRLMVKEGNISVASMMTCTLSVDHRAVDGAMGARFLSTFKTIVEDPLMMVL